MMFIKTWHSSSFRSSTAMLPSGDGNIPAELFSSSYCSHHFRLQYVWSFSYLSIGSTFPKSHVENFLVIASFSFPFCEFWISCSLSIQIAKTCRKSPSTLSWLYKVVVQFLWFYQCFCISFDLQFLQNFWYHPRFSNQVFQLSNIIFQCAQKDIFTLFTGFYLRNLIHYLSLISRFHCDFHLNVLLMLFSFLVCPPPTFCDLDLY